MGVNKASLIFDDLSLLERLINDALWVNLTPLICNNSLIYDRISPSVSRLSDYLPNAGPLSALLPALELSRQKGEQWLWCYACDSLLLPSETIKYMLQAVKKRENNASIIMPTIDTPLPLLGLYHVRVIDDLRNYLNQGERRVMKFCHIYAKRGELYQISLPQSMSKCCNFNTPQEFIQAQEHYQQLREHNTN